MDVPNSNDIQNNEGDHPLCEREAARVQELTSRATQERMDEFLDLASHELRTPLTTIKGNLTLAMRFLTTCLRELEAEQGTLRDRLQEVYTMLERADQQAELQNRLLGDLLETTRIQNKKPKLMFSSWNLVALVSRVIEEHRQMGAPRVIQLELPDTPTITVIADAHHIEHVISSYLSNALKFSPRESMVKVQLQVFPQHTRVAVHDQGPGIPVEEQPRVWERFYRVPGIERKSGPSVGLGLGLHLCRMIIEQHQGQVGLESKPGEGSVFWFTLPLGQNAYVRS